MRLMLKAAKPRPMIHAPGCFFRMAATTILIISANDNKKSKSDNMGINTNHDHTAITAETKEKPE